MSAQHTPGPWWTTDHGIRDRGGYIAHTNSIQRYEGQDARYERELAQREADKRLIAAAPDLLHALDTIGGLSSALRAGGPDPMDLQGLSDALSEAVDIAHAAIAKATGSAS